MSSEYPFLPLGTVASVRSGYAFKSSDMGTEGYPLIKIGSIVPPRVDISSCDRISKEVIEKNARCGQVSAKGRGYSDRNDRRNGRENG
jgi:type I restriction enzyme S subunit